MQDQPDPTPLSPTRRRFLLGGALALAGGGVAGWLRGAEEVSAPADPAPPSEYGVEPLGYAFQALEPHFDARTMEIHHGRHYAGYVNNLNAALREAGLGRPGPLETLVAGVTRLPEGVRTAVRRQGGGAFNHELFWSILTPGGANHPVGYLGQKLEEDFGGYEAFQAAFTQAALGVFGSGWVWLCAGEDEGLFLTTTPNQDCPLMDGLVERSGRPLLGLDVWEHAYYLKYQNRRADYVAAFWKVLNWDQVEANYAQATH